MNLDYLYYFFTVIEEGSITKASQKLHISQPALSAQISSLEKYFQVPLIERSAKGVKMTPAGEVLYLEGKRLTNLFNNMCEKINKHKHIQPKELSVGASTTVGNYAIPCTVYLFKEKFPDCEINLEIANSVEIINQVIEGKICLAVVEGPVTSEMREELKENNIKAKRLGADQLVVVAPHKEPWINRDEISLTELYRENVIIREQGSGIRSSIEYSLKKNNLELKALGVYMELKSISAIISAISANKGISILPKMAIKQDLKYCNLTSLNVEGISFPHTLTVIYQSGQLKEPDYPGTFLDILLSEGSGFC